MLNADILLRMLLVVCPNLAVDRILTVDGFQSGIVQRSSSVLTQPGGKGSNVARVFRQLGGSVVLVGFVGRGNARRITEPLRQMGIHLEAIPAYDRDSRTCTVICDLQEKGHPTVINEESPDIEPGAAKKLLAAVDRWLPRVDAVLTTGSLARGLPTHLYAEILDRARGKLTAIDAAGKVLQEGLMARPTFMKPNAEEFSHITAGAGMLFLPEHTAVTFGICGAALIHDGRYMYARPPRIHHVNAVGAGDAFVAGYIRSLLKGGGAPASFRWAMAAAACDAGTLRPGFVNKEEVRLLHAEVTIQ